MADVSPELGNIYRAVLLGILFLIPLIIVLFLVTYVISAFIKDATFAKSRLHMKITALIALVSFAVTIFCYWFAEQFHYDIFWGHLSYAMVSLFWGHGNAAAYLLFTFRMRHIFAETDYASGKATYALLLSMIFIVWCCQFSIAVLLIGIDTASPVFVADLPTTFSYVNNINGAEIVIQALLSFLLISLFCRKLQCVVRRADCDKMSAMFQRLVTRITVLSCLGATSTVLWLGCAGVMDIDWIYFPDSDVSIKHYLHFQTGVSVVADCAINSVVIFMSFQFESGITRSMYDRWCSGCDSLCQTCCGRLNRRASRAAVEFVQSNEATTTTSTTKQSVEI